MFVTWERSAALVGTTDFHRTRRCNATHDSPFTRDCANVYLNSSLFLFRFMLCVQIFPHHFAVHHHGCNLRKFETKTTFRLSSRSFRTWWLAWDTFGRCRATSAATKTCWCCYRRSRIYSPSKWWRSLIWKKFSGKLFMHGIIHRKLGLSLLEFDMTKVLCGSLKIC